MPKLPVLSAKIVIKMLKKAGFEEWRQKGSHLSMYKKDGNMILTIPVHGGRDLSKGTLRIIISQSGMSVEDFLSLK